MPLDIRILIYSLHMHSTEACRGWLPCLVSRVYLCLLSFVSVPCLLSLLTLAVEFPPAGPFCLPCVAPNPPGLQDPSEAESFALFGLLLL